MALHTPDDEHPRRRRVVGAITAIALLATLVAAVFFGQRDEARDESRLQEATAKLARALESRRDEDFARAHQSFTVAAADAPFSHYPAFALELSEQLARLNQRPALPDRGGDVYERIALLIYRRDFAAATAVVEDTFPEDGMQSDQRRYYLQMIAALRGGDDRAGSAP